MVLSKKALLSGIGGLVGALLAQSLHHQGYEVFALIRHTNTILPEYAQAIFCADWSQDLEQATQSIAFDVVVHAAGRSHVSSQDEAAYLALDCANAHALAVLAQQKNARMLLISSAHAISTQGMIDDDTNTFANTPYSRLKRAVENCVLSVIPEAVICRLGPLLHQRSRGIFGLYLRWVQLGMPVLLPNPDLPRSVLTQTGLEHAFEFLLNNGHCKGCFLIAEHRPYTLEQLAQAIGGASIWAFQLPRFINMFLPEAISMKFQNPLCLELKNLKGAGFEMPPLEQNLKTSFS